MEATLDTLLEHFQTIQESVRKIWHKSKFFRIVSLVTGSLTAAYAFRNMWIWSYRKSHRLPSGPMGIPVLGNGLSIVDPVWLKSQANFGVVTSYMMGSNYGVLINEPHLAKKFYTQPIANNIWVVNEELSKVTFGTANGKPWRDRRRMIYANLMSTMKASYVENATKRFIKTKVFPSFDKSVKKNEATSLKPLFRPIGFNIVCMACFGKELQSLQDPFWLKFDKQVTENNKRLELITALFMMFGDGKFGTWISEKIAGGSLESDFKHLTDIIDGFSKDTKNNSVQPEQDENIKLFNDYVDDYLNNKDGDDGDKYTRRDLLGDMMIMFVAATDTTSAALQCALVLAAKYPKIQQELYEEVIAAFGNDVDKIELRNKGILKIPKLRAFIQETLRIYPPAPTAGFRQILDEGVTIDATDFGEPKYKLPIGTMPIINVAAIGVNPKYWIKDYDEKKHGKINMNEIHFDFWMEDGKFVRQKNGDNFFAFHVGKRDCIGQSLAMKELMIVLAMIFMKYEIKSVDGKTDFEIPVGFNGLVLEPVSDKVVLKPRA